MINGKKIVKQVSRNEPKSRADYYFLEKKYLSYFIKRAVAQVLQLAHCCHVQFVSNAMKFWLYSSASLVACVALLCYTYVTREHFYPSVIYLVTSKVSVLVLSNAALVLTTLFGRLVKSFFLGTLREVEVEVRADS